MITTTPASSLHEDFDESQYRFASDVEEDNNVIHDTQTSHRHRHNQSSSSSSYPRRIAIGDPAINPSPSGRHSRSDRPGGGGGNEGNGNPRGHIAAWEPDETVLECRLCNRRFTAFLRRHHCRYMTHYNSLNDRFCGRVVCYRCSASRHAIPQDRIVHNPFNGNDDTFDEPRLHRVCDTCVPRVVGLAAAIPESSVSSALLEAVSISQSVIGSQIETQDSAGSEVDDRFLIECPVCRTDLRMFGDDDLQAIHVATCLEDHSMSPSFSGGSRHLGIKQLVTF